MKYYQERNGDYLIIDETTNDYYKKNFGKDHFEGRATAITGQVSSVQTTAISRRFLKHCKRVKHEDIPQIWLDILG